MEPATVKHKFLKQDGQRVETFEFNWRIRYNYRDDDCKFDKTSGGAV